ncbi:DgyrCDS518 [Dimorphilus gyrociliatus]|uniref:DgyrCDS518 n=1 Tax=Dimorphilus gyrociliatus TaxID=2664684 RepID=A0A7I8V6E6_9ANNE|nr:DgyrCDS518 [Dimorphilus gyrociliatus]
MASDTQENDTGDSFMSSLFDNSLSEDDKISNLTKLLRILNYSKKASKENHVLLVSLLPVTAHHLSSLNAKTLTNKVIALCREVIDLLLLKIEESKEINITLCSLVTCLTKFCLGDEVLQAEDVAKHLKLLEQHKIPNINESEDLTIERLHQKNNVFDFMTSSTFYSSHSTSNLQLSDKCLSILKSKNGITRLINLCSKITFKINKPNFINELSLLHSVYREELLCGLSTVDVIVKTVVSCLESLADYDKYNICVFQYTLDIFDQVCQWLKSGNSYNHTVLQNLYLIAAHYISVFIEKELGKTEDSTGSKQKCERDMIMIMSGKELVVILNFLFSELSGSKLSDILKDHKDTPIKALLALNFSSLDRIKKINSSVKTLPLLIRLLNYCYTIACSVKDTVISNTNENNDKQVDGEEMDLASLNSLEEEIEKESILGKWMQTLMYPEIEFDILSVDGSDDFDGDELVKKNLLELESTPPAPFLSLGAKILNLIFTSMLSEVASPELRRIFVDDFNGSEMEVISNITSTFDSNFDLLIDFEPAGYFSSMLVKFNHFLIASKLLSEEKEKAILEYLHVYPSKQAIWKLNVNRRVLNVLFQVILLKQQEERLTNTPTKSYEIIINIWNKVLSTLVENTIHPPSKSENQDDLNVEQAQFLVFMFHSLDPIHRKTILSQLLECLIKISSFTIVGAEAVLPLSRLLILANNLLLYFYTPSDDLLEHVQHNLFESFNCKESYILFTFYENLDDRKPSKFYWLSKKDFSLTTNLSRWPRMDGLARTFITTNKKGIDYEVFYRSMTKIFDDVISCSNANGSLELYSIRYALSILWQMFDYLPPSEEFLKHISHSPIDKKKPYSKMVVTRLQNANYREALSEIVTKQGTSGRGEKVVETAFNNCCRIERNVEEILNVLKNAEEISLSSMADLNTSLAKGYALLDTWIQDRTSSRDSESKTPNEIASELILPFCKAIEFYSGAVRERLVNKLISKNKYSEEVEPLLKIIISMTSTQAPICLCTKYLPANTQNIIAKWAEVHSFPNCTSWNEKKDDGDQTTSYLNNVFLTTVQEMTTFPASVNNCVKYVLSTLLQFFNRLVEWCEKVPAQVSMYIFPLLFDASAQYVSEYVESIVHKAVGNNDSEQFKKMSLQTAVNNSYRLALTPSLSEERVLAQSGKHSIFENVVKDEIYVECMKLLELCIEKPDSGIPAISEILRYYEEKQSIVEILLTSASEWRPVAYRKKVLSFFSSLFGLLSSTEEAYYLQSVILCDKLSNIKDIDDKLIHYWLWNMVKIPSHSDSSEEICVTEIRGLLHKLVATMASLDKSAIDSMIAETLLTHLLIISEQLLYENKTVAFGELFVVMLSLATACKKHELLCQKSLQFLEICEKYLNERKVLEKLLCSEENGKLTTMLECISYVLTYIKQIFSCDRVQDQEESDSESCLDEEFGHELAPSEGSDGEDDELCTYTVTQKEFMNQHWYHCYTCNMVDNIGVCTVCAKVCHKGHELAYAKCGSFFCDCGAKEDNSCQALTKRTSTYTTDTMLLTSTGSHPAESKWEAKDKSFASKVNNCLEGVDKTNLISIIGKSSVVENTVRLLSSVIPLLSHSFEVSPSVANIARKHLSDLHTIVRKVEITDSLINSTVVSQDGCLENVKSQYNGDQAQQIRQLISNSTIRRVATCGIPIKKKHYLAISHDKCKLTMFQLSSALKQLEANKSKVTLTRTSSTTLPFAILSFTTNPCNEEVIAVCGLKDCHVLSLTNIAKVREHLALHPSLDAGNYVVKVIWLPASKSSLALITGDFIKIFNLSNDIISPNYYFVVPAGKIKDATFIVTEHGAQYIAIMASTGYVYTQILDETAQNGAFFVTNVIDIKHVDIKTEANGTISGGGGSVYYSHLLQLLFFSFLSGKTFYSPLRQDLGKATNICSLTLQKNVSSSAKQKQALVNWSETIDHPGLLTAYSQHLNIPIVIMVSPNGIFAQEVKTSKSKILDVSLISHPIMNVNDKRRTTLMILCEDGNLKMQSINMETTNFWLNPQVRNPMSAYRPVHRKKIASNRNSGIKNAGQSFPIDFFENCQATNDFEVGGQDLLQVYNASQAKNRLISPGTYVVCANPNGFKIEITNTSTSHVPVGIRIQVGSQSVNRIPSSIDVFGRSVPVNTTRSNRWYDIPFSKEESTTAVRSFSIFFAPSSDPDGVIIIDSIKVHVCSKESFGWSGNETENVGQSSMDEQGVNMSQATDQSIASSRTERLIAGALQFLDSSLKLWKNDKRQILLDLCTNIITLPTSKILEQSASGLLASLHNSRTAYHIHKDDCQLQYVMNMFGSSTSMDSDTFQRLLVIIRSIAVARPYNLTKFCEKQLTKSLSAGPSRSDVTLVENTSKDEENKETLQSLLDNISDTDEHILMKISGIFWKLHGSRPLARNVAPVGLPGLQNTDLTVMAMIDIIDAFCKSGESEIIQLSSRLYAKFLLSPFPNVAFPARMALNRLFKPSLKRVRKDTSPARCSTPAKLPTDDMMSQLESADDETTMVELAIALSLQSEQYSDNSTPNSDDEVGSNAATDGSTLRTSPVEVASVAGSESGGSIIDSISGGARSETSSIVSAVPPSAGEDENNPSMKSLLLDKLTDYIPFLENGLQSIPFLQVIFTLAASMDGNEGNDRAVLDRLISVVVDSIRKTPCETLVERSQHNEVVLLFFRFISVCISYKGVLKSSKVSKNKPADWLQAINSLTSSVITQSNLFEVFEKILKLMLERHWNNAGDAWHSSGEILKVSTMQLPDMTPFFTKPYVKSHSTDVFSSYPKLLTEFVIRIVYQMKKQVDVHEGNPESMSSWNALLCDFLMLSQLDSSVRKQIRKLLLAFAQSKEKYRKIRDEHCLNAYMSGVENLFKDMGVKQLDDGEEMPLSYNMLLKVIEKLKLCLDIANQRSSNWQQYCMKNTNTLPFLVWCSVSLHSAVAPTCLSLLQCALTSQEGEEQIAEHLIPFLAPLISSNLIRKLMLDSNVTGVRWQVHALVLLLWKHLNGEDQRILLDRMWSLWNDLKEYGEKAAQFVDLLGYFSLRTPNLKTSTIAKYVQSAVDVMKEQNDAMNSHPNATFYSHLSNLIQPLVDNDIGYYLENEPCLVCNTPEIAFSNAKLSTLKVDTKFTANTQLVKLVSTHMIHKISFKLTDVKRMKMIRTLNIYYNNRPVNAIVELKNKRELWQKVSKVSLSAGQAEAKVDLPLPITACNLMFEYADFHEKSISTGDTLQCPRCSATVASSPGVCGNCGENVFQCHKCRAINYDEKDPFLCVACGFCKYAKVDISLYARTTCDVGSIESEDDKAKALNSISNLLEKADKLYKDLMGNKPTLETLLLKVVDCDIATGEGGENAAVSTLIHQVANKYNVDCRNTFEDLSKCIEKIVASRKELVEYTKGGQLVEDSKKSKNCYGCSNATLSHCITLLTALCSKENIRAQLAQPQFFKLLLNVNLPKGTINNRGKVRKLICALIRNDEKATNIVNTLILKRITNSIAQYKKVPFLFGNGVRHCILVLAASLSDVSDKAWPLRVRTLLQILLLSNRIQTACVVHYVTLPCVRILKSLLGEKRKSKTAALPIVNANLFLESASVDWVKNPSDKYFVVQKYVNIWRSKISKRDSWVKKAILCKSNRSLRVVTCQLIGQISLNESQRTKSLLPMLISYLESIEGSNGCELIILCKKLIEEERWRHYAVVNCDLIPKLCELINIQVNRLMELEQSTFDCDVAGGSCLYSLTCLLTSLVNDEWIKQSKKSVLLAVVLNAFLSLKKMIVQRTKLLDDTQSKFLEALEQLTSGTEKEKKDFMSVCINTVTRFPKEDLTTPVFIFERVANMIKPEEEDDSEILLNLEKDAQQEDFLQGRMLGNPYSTKTPNIGPLMRDVKNKICTDCELVALLEDDTGMELLVCNKIIALDLSVKDVWRKVWVPQQGDSVAMRVVYRMRGLLGDATEDMINSLTSSNGEEKDDEEVFALASVLAENCNGLDVMLDRLAAIENLTTGRNLMTVLFKLFTYCVKIRICRLALLDKSTIPFMLTALNVCLKGECESLAISVLSIMEAVLQEASAQSPQKYADFTKRQGADTSQLLLLLEHMHSPLVRASSNLLQALMKVVPFLAFGHSEKMIALAEYFEPFLIYDQFDKEHSTTDVMHVDCFAQVVNGIEANANGEMLKDLLLEKGFVDCCIKYLKDHSPPIVTYLATDQDDWKDMIKKPALPYVLRILNGLVKGHLPSASRVSELVNVLHKLEQVSSDGNIGTLAENLLDSIRVHTSLKKVVEDFRLKTKAEKKRKALAMRNKHLDSLGMKTNEKGQVKADVKSKWLEAEIQEETGMVCCICREGYKNQPNKVLAIYTFTRRTQLDEFEAKSRKSAGYSTLTHMNVVHVDCHVAAVRHSRSRDEWESALLHNSNSKCNGLLPLWGPDVQESSFASNLAKHNTYIQDCTGIRDATVTHTLHDLKYLLFSLALSRTLTGESGGGGRQSNLQLVPHIMHMALYVLNTTRIVTKELEGLIGHIQTPGSARWLQYAYEVDNALFWTILALHLFDDGTWKKYRLSLLKHLIVMSHARNVLGEPENGKVPNLVLPDLSPCPFEVYKPYVIFWCIVDAHYKVLFDRVKSDLAHWPADLALFIRRNDLTEQSDKLLVIYEKEMLSAQSFDQLFELSGLKDEIKNPYAFITEALAPLPTK